MFRRRRGRKSGYYDVQQVCLNGHQITDRYNSKPNRRKSHCSGCGEETIHQCPECDADIEGDYISPNTVFIGVSTPVPDHCDSCGAEFPWASKEEEDIDRAQVPGAISILEQLFERFHIVARSLRDRHDNRPTFEVNDEYDVQDLLHSLLKIFFDDIRPEEWTPSYAGKSGRMDFLLKEEEIVIETKMTREGLDEKEIGDQLIIDIQRYQEHPHCDTLICFVYDPMGKIGNPASLERDLSREEESLTVEVYVTPKGL